LKREIEYGGCVDEHMRDQLVVFQALADGKCEIETGGQKKSLHAQTAEWVCSELLGVQSYGEDSTSCEGVGWLSGEVWADRLKAKSGTESLEEELKAMGIDD
jgi:RNA 3'-terminal phosphate cyclase (ATP)